MQFADTNRVGWIVVGCSIVLAVLAAPLSEARASDDSSKKAKVVYDTLEARQTLGNLALEHGVSVEELEKWNDIEPEEVQPGMRLIVKSNEKIEEDKKDKQWVPVIHRIKRGDTLGEIAEEYNVKVRDVKRWNRRLNPRRLQLGDRVRLYVPGNNGTSSSYGRASNGRLYNGVPLRDGPGLEVRSIAHAYGTERVVNMLAAAGEDVKARWPRTPDLIVGHLSYKNGGPMSPHKSHQSGRDADLSFYHRGNVELKNFEDMTVETFDARKNWHVFKTLIDSGQVQFIFVSYFLQKPLYEYARSIGYTKEQLEPILQYPRSKWEPVGIIRHSPGHDDHWHIRFTCGPKDRHCN